MNSSKGFKFKVSSMSLKDEPVTLSEEVLIGEDKELLRKQLELLKSEYERTAQKLQRAKRKEEIRKHVQKKISDHNWPLQNDTSVTCEISSSCSSVSNLLSNQTLETSKKVALVRFQLPEEPNTSGWGTPTCRRCPTQRLRSRRSRLRLQNRGTESDTDHSQEKEREREAAGHGVDERVRQKNGEKNQEVKWTKNGNNQEMERALGMEWKGIQTVEEKNENGWIEKVREGEDDDERHYQSKSNGDPPKGHQKSVDSENSCQNLLPLVGPSPTNLRDVDVSPGDRNLQSSPAPADHSLVQLQSCQSALSSDQSEADMSGTSSGADKSCEHTNGIQGSSGEAAFLDSCTVIEGLPFPVEYYVRTTRRMAAANSSIDLDAIIHSQLTGGRRRRRYSPLQTRSGGLKESAEPGGKPHDRPRGRGRSQRGRRGRGQKRVGSIHIHSPPSSGVTGCSQVEPSPEIRPQSESSFLVKSAHQIEPIPSPGPALTKKPVSGFRHLLDTQLYLGCQLLPDSDVYPIFRKRRGLAEGTASQFECQNDSTPLLPSLASLAQALRTKDVRNLGQLLTTFDVQDFHLPDDEFGQLKLERLCSNVSYANVEPLTPRTNMSHIGRRRSFRIRRNTVSSDVLGVESEVYTPEPLPPSTSLDCSFPLSQLSSGDQSQMKDVHIEPSNLGQLKSAQDEDQADEDQMTKCQLQASLGLVELEASSVKLASVGSQYDIGTSDKEKVNRGIDYGEACPALPAVLNLSLSSTSFTQRAPDPFLPCLGMTPRHVSPSSTLILNPFASSPSDQGLVPNSSQTLENGPSSPITVTKMPGREATDCQATSSPQASVIQSLSAVSEGAESLPQEVHQLEDALAISENEISTQRSLSSQNFHEEADSASKKDDQIQIPSNQHHGTTESARQDLQSKSLSQDWFAKTSQSLDDVPVSDVLQKTHTLKALDEGCVLDACLLELTDEHWVLCVADEWSVYAWARSEGVQEWSLLHTWTFTQSIISLQAVLDSAGLLCVSLGRLEITEVRTLYCPTAAGEFSQAQVCVGALQAVCVVCERRLVCCSIPGVQQQVTVFTLTQEGCVADSHALASTERSVRALAAVEGQRDALIGWTECHTLLIWNMKSSLLLQSLQLTGAAPTSSCLRGYSYKGALCVLLQSTAEDESLLFALIAANPLTGKHTTLSSISHPAPHTARLLDGDVCGSSLVAVFQSGRLALWDMRGGGAALWVGGAAAESCHLAKWAGPNMLITGHTNGDIGLFHYKVPHNMKSV